MTKRDIALLKKVAADLEHQSSADLWDFWYIVNHHPRLAAKALGITVKEVKRLRVKAANYATYLSCKALGRDREAQTYLDIYHRI